MTNVDLRIRIFSLFLFLFILIPFSPSIPLFTIAEREVNVGIHTLLIALILIVTLFNGAGLKGLKEPATLTIILLVWWTLLTIIVSAFHAGAPAIANSVVTWLRWVQFIPIFCLIVYGVGKEIDFKKIVRILFFLGLVIAAWGIYETFFPSEFAVEHFRGAATFTKPLFREHDLLEVIDPKTGFYAGSANYNIAGLFSAMVALVAIPFLFKSYGSYIIIKTSLLSFVITFLLIVGVFVTYSRSALLSLIGGMLVVNSIKAPISRVLLTVVLLVLGAIILVVFFSEWGFTQLILSTITYLPAAVPIVMETPVFHEAMGFDGNVFGAAMRFVAISEALRIFMESPLLGVGFFGFSQHSPLGTAENFFAQILAETGIIGFTLFIIFLFHVWQCTKIKFKRETFAYKYQIGFRGVFVAGIIANLTGTLFYDTRIWGLFLVLSAIMIRLARDEYRFKQNGRKVGKGDEDYIPLNKH